MPGVQRPVGGQLGRPLGQAIRADIAARLERGQSADEIRDYYAGRFGESSC